MVYTNSLFKTAVLFLSSGMLWVAWGQFENDDTTDSWLVLNGNHKIHSNWTIPTVMILRHHDMFEAYEFSFFRSGVTYKSGEHSHLGAGFAYLDANSYQHNDIPEKASQFWWYGEYSHKLQLNRNTIAQRLRQETRWISTPDRSYVNPRVRYRIQFTKPIGTSLYVKTFNEIFLNLEGPTFNQNRFYMGLGQKIASGTTLDIGYLKNHFATSQRDVLRVCLSFRTDFTKKDRVAHQSP
ncbi:MAG: DUF2490 domain-containing protein [Bacteroidota bacterium]